MQRISFGKKVTYNTFIQGDGTIASASSSSASTDGSDTGAHVSDAGDDMMILSGTKEDVTLSTLMMRKRMWMTKIIHHFPPPPLLILENQR
jgi:hypothetical protein